MSIIIEFCISKTVVVPNFTLNNFEFLNQICSKRFFFVWKRSGEYHHKNPLNRISEGTNFQLKQTILNFQTKFHEKWYPLSKTKKANTTIKFNMIKLDFCLRFLANCLFYLEFSYFRSNLPIKGTSGLKFNKLKLEEVPCFILTDNLEFF